MYPYLQRSDGSLLSSTIYNRWDSIFELAMAEWTAQSNFTFARQYATTTPDPCLADGLNGVAFALDFCGVPFEDEIVALTLISYVENPGGLGSFYDADIIFNDNVRWDYYSPSQNAAALPGSRPVDFYRVALHELGHGLGLGHENTADSIMSEYVGDTYFLTDDDIAGAAELYGAYERVALYFPHVASDNLWETEIGLVNTSDNRSLTGQLVAYSAAGTEVSVRKTVTLSPRQRSQLIVGDAFPSSSEIRYITFVSTATDLVGYTKFYVENKYRVAVPAVEAADINSGEIYVPHIASDDNWWTGIGLLNTTTEPREVLITFNTGETMTLTLAAKAHTSFTLEAYAGAETAVISRADGVIGLELFGSKSPRQNYLSGILLTDDKDYSFVVPHIVNDETWWTGLVVYSPWGGAKQSQSPPLRQMALSCLLRKLAWERGGGMWERQKV